MKKIVIVIFVVLSLVSCLNDKQNEIDFESIGTIIDYDKSMCACCGDGWIISIDGEEQYKTFDSLPAGSSIDLENASFPISVKLDWEEENNDCILNKIHINRIKKR